MKTQTQKDQNEDLLKIESSELNILEEIVKEEEKEFDSSGIGQEDFDIFKFEQETSKENVYPTIARYCLKNTGTLEIIDNSNLTRFLALTESKYHDVPYHSSIHAADVTQTMFIMITKGKLIERLQLNQIDILSLILSSLLHDLGHPSTNNTFQLNAYTDFAVSFNDKSVLENYHVSESFKILKDEEYNILTKLDYHQFRRLRKRMIEQILATDMMSHAKTMSLVKNLVQNYKDKNEPLVKIDSQRIFDEQQEIMNFVLHTCDISHSAKEFDISYKWTYKIMEEFWNQGDLEKNLGLNVSFLCDRKTADVPKGQVFFIKSIILPNFEVLYELCPELEYYVDNVERNLDRWIEISGEKNKLNTGASSEKI